MYLPKEKEAHAMNEIIKTYERNQEILKRYLTAKEAGDQAGMQKASEDHDEFTAENESKSWEFNLACRLYKSMKERGNDYIDFCDTIEDAKVPVFIEYLRKQGFKYFTFSSTWSSAVETAWILVNAGCSLKGLIQINGQYKSFMGNDYEKAPAYLFTID